MACPFRISSRCNSARYRIAKRNIRFSSNARISFSALSSAEISSSGTPYCRRFSAILQSFSTATSYSQDEFPPCSETGMHGKTYKLCLMHYPILMWNGQHRGSILLYAHTHNTVEEAFFQKCVKELNENKKLNVQQGKPIRAINVGCMMPYMGYEPRTLKEILSAHE